VSDFDDDGFIQHFDLESELYEAMTEETNRLGPPELNMDRIHRARRRRRMVLAGSGAVVAVIGTATVALAVGGSGTHSDDSTKLAAAGASTPTSGPSALPSVPPSGSPCETPLSGHCDPCRSACARSWCSGTGRA